MREEDNNNNPDMENPHLDCPGVETPTQINTNKQNTNKQIDKDDKTKISSFFIEEDHNILTLELINNGYIKETDTQIFYYDKLFDELLKENSYKDLIQIVHYIVSRVVKRNFKDEDDNIIENKFGYFKNAINANINKLNNEIDDLWKDDYDWLNDNLGKCYLAIDNSKVLGVIMGVLRSYDEYDYLDNKCPRCGVITELVVSKTAKGKGIGKLLISKMEEYFKSINCEYITVDVFAYNAKGIKFYEKEGYHTRGLIDIKNISKEHINYKCLIANKEMIIKKWDEEIKKHNNSELWTNFKEQSLRNINTRIVYMGLLGDEIIAEATAVVSSDDLDMQNKEGLVDAKKAYLTAFRTNK